MMTTRLPSIKRWKRKTQMREDGDKDEHTNKDDMQMTSRWTMTRRKIPERRRMGTMRIVTSRTIMTMTKSRQG